LTGGRRTVGFFLVVVVFFFVGVFAVVLFFAGAFGVGRATTVGTWPSP
jgi:hypothetical protein